MLLVGSLWHKDSWLHARKGPIIGALYDYGIRLLAKQILGIILDMEVDQSDSPHIITTSPATVRVRAKYNGTELLEELLEDYPAGWYFL